MNDRFNIRYFNKNTRKFEYYKIGTVNTIPFTDCTVYEQGQFCTGIKDKTGALIFEGDIVKFNFDTDEINAVVSWDDKELIGFYLNTTDYFKDKYVTDYDFYKNDYEVIGNIYENKELLESEG